MSPRHEAHAPHAQKYSISCDICTLQPKIAALKAWKLNAGRDSTFKSISEHAVTAPFIEPTTSSGNYQAISSLFSFCSSGIKATMITRYESTQSSGEEPMTLIFQEGAFESLPFEIRLMGPWFGCSYGEVSTLKPAQRGELLRQGYVVLRHAASLRDAA
jgi:hypothetical protein